MTTTIAKSTIGISENYFLIIDLLESHSDLE